jgi:hypothetical protein
LSSEGTGVLILFPAAGNAQHAGTRHVVIFAAGPRPFRSLPSIILIKSVEGMKAPVMNRNFNVLLIFFYLIVLSCGSRKFKNETHSRSLSTSDVECTAPEWCNIEMPDRSYFRFGPPTNLQKWKLAQAQAASGEHVLLKRIRQVFRHPMDFLDGDIVNRNVHSIADVFLDKNNDLTQLLPKSVKSVPPKSPAKVYSWQDKKQSAFEGDVVIPKDYNVDNVNRAPVVMVGYSAFSRKGGSPYFRGGLLGEAGMERGELYQQWNQVKAKLQQPFILLHAANENWGLLSTLFPNRTVDWGSCCGAHEDRALMEILNSDKVLLFVVAQHHNLTHPKLLTLPRGVPLNGERKRNVLYDIIQSFPDTSRKQTLLFTASSNWKHRPHIAQCISDKFVTEEDRRNVNINRKKTQKAKGAEGEMDYYRNLAGARMGVAVPGLGYDTFRYLILCMMLHL